jgi:hypothetical protein
MRGWILQLGALFFIAASLAFGQVGNGTITGIVTDPAGAVVPGASVEAKNAGTGVVFPAVTTNAGNYTIPDLPVGTYSVTAKVQGFKTYTHTNIAMAATQVVKEDIALQVGNASESITVSAEASLLKTESGDVTHNMSIDQLDDLPLLGIGTANSGTSGVRNPYNALQTLPGVSSYASSGQFTMNGLGGAMTETMRIEGQDATSRLFATYDYTQMGQPSADAIQEVAYQTSNYAAEYGQAGSVVINMTMKSGTNQYHGTGFDYFVNEDLNAGYPFSVNSAGTGKERPRNRRNDFGGTLGGPIRIPKIYDGRNKTFFFFNYEQFLETTQYSFTDTVPNAAYLTGNFSAISSNGTCSACAANGIQQTPITTDPLGNSVFANEIFNPTTRATTASGLGYAMPFQGNIIPQSMINPTSLKFMALFPAPTNSNLANNYSSNIAGGRYSAIPSIKIDHNLSDKDKLSFFWTRINTESQISAPLGNADGLPEEIGGYRGTFIPTYTTRLNYDRTLSPTLLLHIGAGYYHTRFADNAPFTSFNPSAFGLSNFLIDRQFPSVTGMCVAPPPGATGCGGVLGGMQNIGTSGQIQTLNFEEKPTFNTNLTWIKGAHTFKAGAEVYFEGILDGSFAGVTLATGTFATSEPFVPTGSLNGNSMGFGFASFLLGDYGATSATGALTSTAQTPQENYRYGNQEWGLYLQDTWKVTRKLTVNYGLRWDYATAQHEQYGRLGQFSPTVANDNAGGTMGGTIYANTCNCPFYQKTYPYGIGPRLGIAYQINDKTVFRGGWGVNYQFSAYPAGAIVTLNGTYPLAGVNPYVNISTPGSIVSPAWPDTQPDRYPVAGTVGGTLPFVPDGNENRPPRVNQWSFGLQREITKDFIVDASYVGNRGVWEEGPFGTTSGPLNYLSQVSPAKFAKYGLYPYPGTGPAGYNFSIPGNPCVPGNDCARALLSLPLNNPAVVSELASAGYPNGITPYPGFAGTTLLSALYPYPQFGNLEPSDSPTGDSRYDSLQIKVTKRLSRGLLAGGAYTWAKGLTRMIPEDIFNAAGNKWTLQQIPPQALTFNVTYTLQKYGYGFLGGGTGSKIANTAIKDWQVGFFAQYQSGQFLLPPVSPTANYLPSEDVRTGQPLYLVNINNIHSYNPETQQVLNPAAWAPCPTNTTCGGAYTSATTGLATSDLYYSDFRGPRTPRENANIGRHFRIKEKYDLYIRAEFVNIFNRTIMPNPIVTNPQLPITHGAGNGTILTGGFGVMNVYNAPGTYPAVVAGAVTQVGRTGTLIAKFQF